MSDAMDAGAVDAGAMDDGAFDRALVGAAFEVAAARGWNRLSVAEAARQAALPLPRARARFPGRAAVLLRFGVQVDQAALSEPAAEPDVRGRLFDLLMRRFDALQAHRDGVLALLRAVPTDPALALLLGTATLRSMGWMLEAAGVPAHGLRGRLRRQGLLAVWLSVLRAWERDESEDLSGTMAALDKALDRADRAARFLGGGTGDDLPPDLDVVDLPPDEPLPDEAAPEADDDAPALPPPPPDVPDTPASPPA